MLTLVIEQFDCLKVLYISYSEVSSEQLASAFTKMPNLERLDITSCTNIDETLSCHFASLQHLQKLVCEMTVINESFASVSLLNLNIYVRNTSVVDFSILNNLPSLTDLKVWPVPGKYIDKHFSELTNIKNVSLGIDSTVVSNFKKYTFGNIQKIELSGRLHPLSDWLFIIQTAGPRLKEVKLRPAVASFETFPKAEISDYCNRRNIICDISTY